jgi:flagellar hook-length control protein FliK
MQAAASFFAPVSKSSAGAGHAGGATSADPTKPEDATNGDADAFTQALAGSMGVTGSPTPTPPATTSDTVQSPAAKSASPKPTQIFAVVPPVTAQAAAAGAAGAASSPQTVPTSELTPTTSPAAADLPASVIDAIAAQAGASSASPAASSKPANGAQANSTQASGAQAKGTQANAQQAGSNSSASGPAQGAAAGSATPLAFSAVSFSVTRTDQTTSSATTTAADPALPTGDAVPVASMTLTADETAAALPASVTAAKTSATTATAAKTSAKSDASDASAETDPTTTAGQPAGAAPVAPTPQVFADAGDRDTKSGSDTPAQAPQTQTVSNSVDNASLSALATAPVTTQAVIQTQTAAAATSAAIVSQIATQVAKSVDGKSTRFDITLDPAGLGQVNVKVEIGAQGQVTAQLSFDNAHTAAEAKSQAGQLQQALEQAGFNIAQGGLSFDVSGQGAGFAGHDAPAQQQAANSVQTPDSTPDAVAAIAAANASLPALGVDITI